MSDKKDIEWAVGRLEGKLDSMLKFEEAEHAKIDERFGRIEKKVDVLNGFHWRIAGGVTVVMSLLGIVAKFF